MKAGTLTYPNIDAIADEFGDEFTSDDWRWRRVASGSSALTMCASQRGVPKSCDSSWEVWHVNVGHGVDTPHFVFCADVQQRP